ncbi:MAG: hypothetical protein GY788_19580, partial [bacterium]|nr:hypothetical protein [bacterium]
IAERLGCDHIELDAIHHLPDWTPIEREEMRRIVTKRTETESWVVDGNNLTTEFVCDRIGQGHHARELPRTPGSVARSDHCWTMTSMSLPSGAPDRSSRWTSMLAPVLRTQSPPHLGKGVSLPCNSNGGAVPGRGTPG